ncbi:MAG: hypothetical protein PHG64_14365 [Paludibacter sp.]|nr:hypothetical protein [Paludibacter sp.]
MTYGFYNSLNGDRKYDATQLSSLFDGLIVDGIFASIGTGFVVKADTGITVNVGIGKAWFNKTWTLNDAILPMEAPISEVLLDRIDAIVIEVDTSEAVRANSIKFVKGIPSSSPVNPTLASGSTLNQYPLCYIYRPAGSSEITQAQITNMVGSEATPFVTGILQTISLDELLGQWEDELDQFVASEQADFTNWMHGEKDEYDDWFQKLEDVLDDNAAANLLNIINEHKEDYVYQVAGGTGAAITLTINNLTDGYPMTFIASADNNGDATTINTKPLYKPNTTDSPNIVAGKAYTVWYDEGEDCFFIKASAEGNATVDKVLAGYTFSNDSDTGLVGTAFDAGSLIAGDAVALDQGAGLKGVGPGGSPTKKAEVTINVASTYRIKFSLHNADAGGTTSGRIYKNGVAFGTLRSMTGTTKVEYSEDLAFTVGDSCEIWISSTTSIGYISSLKVCFSISNTPGLVTNVL